MFSHISTFDFFFLAMILFSGGICFLAIIGKLIYYLFQEHRLMKNHNQAIRNTFKTNRRKNNKPSMAKLNH